MNAAGYVPIGKKQRANNSDFLFAWYHIADLVSRDSLDDLIDATVTRMIAWRKQHGDVAYCWSGGKDSLALQWLVEQAYGVDVPCVMGLTHLEYPVFLQWVTDHMPQELTLVNTGQDIDWLLAHPRQLFPKTDRDAAVWFKSVQHTAQDRFWKQIQPRALIVGRRRADGNYMGGGESYTTSEGITRYAPIFDWTHEQILALIHYEGIELPPIYHWPRGFQVGTGAWPARQWCYGEKHGWQEVYEIDKHIVKAVAKHYPVAQAFLATIGQEWDT